MILPEMHWADSSRGRTFAKDPSVIRFGGRYLMYYSICPFGDGREDDGWALGIAASNDLTHWEKVGEILPMQEIDRKGFAAPAAWVRDGRVHLFYQTYGNWRTDAICHAWSEDGIHFIPDPSNPVFAPTGEWTAGRAIDAEICPVGDRYFLYYATRDPEMEIQMIGVAATPLDSDFSKASWTQLTDGPILVPELPWERRCIEAPIVFQREGRYWMFYAGGYNNEPQQIGVAHSEDGIRWTRLSDEPFLPAGKPGEWNASESGHPGLFIEPDGTTHLFYQGNCDNGASWYLSKVIVDWVAGRPVLRKNR